MTVYYSAGNKYLCLSFEQSEFQRSPFHGIPLYMPRLLQKHAQKCSTWHTMFADWTICFYKSWSWNSVYKETRMFWSTNATAIIYNESNIHISLTFTYNWMKWITLYPNCILLLTFNVHGHGVEAKWCNDRLVPYLKRMKLFKIFIFQYAIICLKMRFAKLYNKSVWCQCMCQCKQLIVQTVSDTLTNIMIYIMAELISHLGLYFNR